MCIYIAIPKHLDMKTENAVESIGKLDKQHYTRVEGAEKLFFISKDRPPTIEEYALHHDSKPRPYVIERCKTLIEHLRAQDEYKECRINVIVHWRRVEIIDDLHDLSHELLKSLQYENISVGYISKSNNVDRKEQYIAFESAYKALDCPKMYSVLDQCVLTDNDDKSSENRDCLEATYRLFQQYLIHRFLAEESFKAIKDVDPKFKGFSWDGDINTIRTEFIDWFETNRKKML